MSSLTKKNLEKIAREAIKIAGDACVSVYNQHHSGIVGPVAAEFVRAALVEPGGGEYETIYSETFEALMKDD